MGDCKYPLLGLLNMPVWASWLRGQCAEVSVKEHVNFPHPIHCEICSKLYLRVQSKTNVPNDQCAQCMTILGSEGAVETCSRRVTTSMWWCTHGGCHQQRNRWKVQNYLFHVPLHLLIMSLYASVAGSHPSVTLLPCVWRCVWYEIFVFLSILLFFLHTTRFWFRSFWLLKMKFCNACGL